MKFSFFLLFSFALSAQTIWFEPNRGQVNSSVQFVARTAGGYAYFGHNQMSVRDVHIELVGARSTAPADLEEPTGGITSYFIGRTEKDWHTGIPQYRRIRYKNIYAGINLVYYAKDQDVEYDFILKPGADPNQIKLAYNKPVRLDSNGDLLIAGLRQKRPKVYQEQREIACNYLVRDGIIQLAIADYDHSQPLTVDPVLEFSTYLGGVSAEGGYALAFDSQGSVYLAGASQAPAQPDLNPFQQTTALINSPVVFKMTPDGRRILYYAYVGNGGWDQAFGMRVDADGSAVITGNTRNASFPLKNAFQSQYKSAYGMAFITKLSPDGKSLIYSSYVGGSYAEEGKGLVLDTQGNAIIAGTTHSNDFPVKLAFQKSYSGSGDCYAAKITPRGDLLWSTYVGGSGSDTCLGIAADQQGYVFIAGGSNSLDFPLKSAMQTTMTPRTSYSTPILVKLSPDGSMFAATFLGGPVAGFATSVALDSFGNVYVAGGVDPALTTKNAFQPRSGSSGSGFLLEIDKALQNVSFSTYFGGSVNDSINRLAVDQFGSIYVTGYTSSTDFPMKGSFQQFIGGGVCQCDVFVAKFAPGAQSLIYSTLLGGHNGEEPGGLAVDSFGNAYVTGWTLSDNFPTKNAFQATYGGGGDMFFAKISDNTPLAPSPLTVAPGRLVFQFTQSGAPPTSQHVSVSGSAFTASASAPWLVANASGSSVTVSVNPTGLGPNAYNATVILTPPTGSVASIEVTLTVLALAPVLTSIDPALVPMGSDDTTIMVHGSGFTSTLILQVDGIPWTVTPVQFIDASTFKFSMPANYFSGQYNHTIAIQTPQSALSNVLSVAVGQPAPQFSAASVVNAASYIAGVVAPGEIITVFGTNFGTQVNTQVSFDGIPATLVYVTPTQLAATVPYSVVGVSKTMMVVGSNGIESVPVALSVTPAVPAIFTANASGKGQAAALNQDNSVNSPLNPAPAGSIVVFYATGGGTLTTEPLPQLTLPVSATIDDLAAPIYYAGVAPGLVSGAMQINVKIPATATHGASVPVVVTVGEAISNTVTIAVR